MYDEYKQNRKKPKEEDEAKKYEEFFAVLNDLPDSLNEEVLKFRGIEADDILTYLVKNISQNYDHTWIVSSDRDLYQLIDDKVSIFNLFSRKEITKQTLKENFDLSPDEYLLSRIIEGDKSDNIIGVEGIGPKRAQGLAKEHKTFEILLQSLPVKGRAKYIQNLNASRDVLERNEKLISLKKYNEDSREIVRKIIHIGIGPLIPIAQFLKINQNSALIFTGIVSLMVFTNYNYKLFPTIEDVERKSYGTLFYCLSLFILIYLFWDKDPYALISGFFIMTFGDGLAGLIGKSFNSKSWIFFKQKKQSQWLCSLSSPLGV